MNEKTGAMAVQHGGNHYKGMKIEVVEFCEANNIPFLEGTVIKHIARHRLKNKAEDIKKAIHYSQIILRLVYGIDSNISFNENETEGTIGERAKAKCQAQEFLEKWEQAGAAQVQIDDAQKKERKVRRYPAVIYDNHDGDTVSAAIELGMGLTLNEKCRLRGINAPEMNTVKGKQARDHLHDLLEEYDQDGDEPVPYTMVEIVEGDERDKYGRLLVRIIGINPGESDQEVDINQLMIDNGQAVEYMAWAENDEWDDKHQYTLLHDACWELFNAPKTKPLQTRLNDKENAALEKIKDLISGD